MLGQCFKVSCHFFKTKRGAAGVDSDGDQVRDFAARIPHKHTHAHTAKHQFTTITSSSSSKSNSSSPTVPPPTSSHPLPVCPLHCAYSLSLCRALSSCLSLSLSLSKKLMLCLRALSLIYTCSLLCVCVSVCVYWCCINKSNQRTFLSNPTQNETERRTWLCYCVINFRVYEAG